MPDPIDLPTTYRAIEHEADVYRRWDEAGCFAAGAGKRADKPTYCIMIPPPNVTGNLHMGHALNNTLQDTLIRWKRMQGFDTLWQPGADHAGIATQSVVAKSLDEAGEPSKEELGRERFLEKVWEWKEQYGGNINRQLRKLGASCDWSRERFTMDAGLSRAVRENFVRLYEAGLIYKGERMVNWSPVLQTALSNDEVEMEEVDSCMWKLRYPLSDGSGHIDVETTRPETFFGDTAVAVHPEDPRYAASIGKTVTLPIVGREIPVIGDTHADPGKGTGAVKITPAHDPNDHEVGKRHDLPLVRVIGLDGHMLEGASRYAGMERFACRKQLLADLEADGVLQGATPIRHAVGHCYRSHVPIEPMVTEQWFCSMRPLAERALAETRAGRVSFHPERWAKVYAHWLENVQDWCLSRQIWWGHRIPAWTCSACGELIVVREDPTRCPACGGTALEQDPDVLDTWFSSALWPFSTLGWPADTAELARYYPTDSLVTDRGIIYLWVARMVMMGLFDLDTRPFDDVYIHGTVLDETGTKMSKSLKNGIDPLVMIDGGDMEYHPGGSKQAQFYECPGYGADAVRSTLLDMTTEGQDLKLSPNRFEAGRNFANKIYNAGRFLLLNLSQRPRERMVTREDLITAPLGFEEQWILDRLQAATADCQRALAKYRFSDYMNSAYRFFRDDLCDWYLEWAKRQFRAGPEEAECSDRVLIHCFDQVLRLLHPAMPFLTELLWQQLQPLVGGTAWAPDTFLMLQPWPEVDEAMVVPGLCEAMELLQAVVSGIRQVRNEMGLPDREQLAVLIEPQADEQLAARIEAALPFLADRANASVRIADLASVTTRGLTAVVGTISMRVEFTGEQEELLTGYRARLEKQLAAKQKAAKGKQARLDNPGYVNKAPAAKVQETRDLLAADEAEIAKLQATIAGL
ncbi:MAG: valine--tRNA ligase [Planctomycetota bacterium]